MLGDLSRYRWGTGFGHSHQLVAAVDDIAKALQGLWQISNDTIDRITIVGGVESAFIAALAT